MSVLKEQRPDYIPVLLSGYREHGVFHTQVNSELNMAISPEASYLYAAVLLASSLSRWMFGTSYLQHSRCEADDDTPKHNRHCFSGYLFQGASAVAGLVGFSNAKLGSSKTR